MAAPADAQMCLVAAAPEEAAGPAEAEADVAMADAASPAEAEAAPTTLVEASPELSATAPVEVKAEEAAPPPVGEEGARAAAGDEGLLGGAEGQASAQQDEAEAAEDAPRPSPPPCAEASDEKDEGEAAEEAPQPPPPPPPACDVGEQQWDHVAWGGDWQVQEQATQQRPLQPDKENAGADNVLPGLEVDSKKAKGSPGFAELLEQQARQQMEDKKQLQQKFQAMSDQQEAQFQRQRQQLAQRQSREQQQMQYRHYEQYTTLVQKQFQEEQVTVDASQAPAWTQKAPQLQEAQGWAQQQVTPQPQPWEAGKQGYAHRGANGAFPKAAAWAAHQHAYTPYGARGRQEPRW